MIAAYPNVSLLKMMSFISNDGLHNRVMSMYDRLDFQDGNSRQDHPHVSFNFRH